MKFEVQLTGPSGKKLCTVELERDANRWKISLDGQPVHTDAVEINPHTLSLLLEGQSYEIRITPSPEGALKLQTRLREFTAEVGANKTNKCVDVFDAELHSRSILVGTCANLNHGVCWGKLSARTSDNLIAAKRYLRGCAVANVGNNHL